MAGVPDKGLVPLGGFTAGLNNIADITRGPVDDSGMPTALREAVNVDLDGTGMPRRRRGRLTRIPGIAHSLFAGDGLPHLFAVVDGNLNAYRDAATGLVLQQALHTGLGDRYVTYATDDFDVWWSNGVLQGRIAEDLSLHPFWPGTPDAVAAAPSANGGLAAGQYEVSVTITDAQGRESAASTPVMVVLATGQGIAVTLPAAPAEAARWRVYVSAADGDVLHLAAEAPMGASAIHVGSGRRTKKLETGWLHVLPPCDVLRYGHGRLLGLAGNVLVWSEAYRLGLMADTNHLIIGKEATLLEPVGDGGDGSGWWVADHKRTYWMAGGNPKNWTHVVRYGHAAVPGTSRLVDGTLFGYDSPAPVAYWMAANGVPCVGLPGGTVVPLRENQLALPVDAERGASGVMLFDGVRQILTTTLGGVANAAAARDDFDVVQRRNGVVI